MCTLYYDIVSTQCALEVRSDGALDVENVFLPMNNLIYARLYVRCVDCLLRQGYNYCYGERCRSEMIVEVGTDSSAASLGAGEHLARPLCDIMLFLFHFINHII